MSAPRVLDACCGSRMFWFDRTNPDAVFVDKRCETHELTDSSSRGGSRTLTDEENERLAELELVRIVLMTKIAAVGDACAALAKTDADRRAIESAYESALRRRVTAMGGVFADEHPMLGTRVKEAFDSSPEKFFPWPPD